MRIVLYPGSFDPVTAGHMDIIERAAGLFGRVIVAVLHNEEKPSGAFSVPDRLALLRIATANLHNIMVQDFSGLLVHAARKSGADAVLRGLRTADDIGPELQMARLNRHLSGVETVFLAASPPMAHISSQRVREIGRLGGDLRGLVPEAIREQIEGVLRNG